MWQPLTVKRYLEWILVGAVPTESLNHWDWKGHLETESKPAAQKRVNESRLLGAGSSWVLSLSKDGGCSPAFVGYLIPCLTTLTVFLKHKKSSSIYIYRKYMGSIFALFYLVFSDSGPFTGYHWEESCSTFFTPPVTYLCTLVRCTRAHLEKPFWSQGQTVPALSASPCTADVSMGCLLQSLFCVFQAETLSVGLQSVWSENPGK